MTPPLVAWLLACGPQGTPPADAVDGFSYDLVDDHFLYAWPDDATIFDAPGAVRKGILLTEVTDACETFSAMYDDAIGTVLDLTGRGPEELGPALEALDAEVLPSSWWSTGLALAVGGEAAVVGVHPIGDAAGVVVHHQEAPVPWTEDLGPGIAEVEDDFFAGSGTIDVTGHDEDLLVGSYAIEVEEASTCDCGRGTSGSSTVTEPRSFSGAFEVVPCPGFGERVLDLGEALDAWRDQVPEE